MTTFPLLFYRIMIDKRGELEVGSTHECLELVKGLDFFDHRCKRRGCDSETRM